MTPEMWMARAAEYSLMIAFLLCVLSGLTLLFMLQQRLGERERRLSARLKALLREGKEPVVALPEAPVNLPDLYQGDKKRTRFHERIASDGRLRLLIAALMLAVGVAALLAGAPPFLGLAMVAIALLGSGAMLFLYLRRRRWQRQFAEQLPEAIDIIIRGARVGMSLQENFRVIASEMQGPLGREFRSLAEKLAIGIDLETAFSAAVEKSGAREMQFMATTLILQRRTGGQYAEVLENLSSVLRERRARHLKARALTAEARTSAYIVAGVTAVILLILALTSRTQFDFLLNDPVGNQLLVYSGISLVAGFYAMSRLLGRLK